jgi:hypothetical protein
MSMEPMSALPAVTSVQKITATPGPSKPTEPASKAPADSKDPASKVSMKQALGMVINKKNLHGGAHPDRKPLQINSMIADPNEQELDEMGNPLDYFSIYK